MALTQEEINSIATAVRNELSPELSLLREQYELITDIHLLMGLNANFPLYVSQSERIAGRVEQDITLDTINKSTIVKRRQMISDFHPIGIGIIGSTFKVG